MGRARRARCLPNDERAQGVFPTTNERKEARAAREPHNDSVSDELLWGAHVVRAVFPTMSERRGSSQRRMSAKKLLWGAHAVRAVFPTSNERKEARAAREPHNDPLWIGRMGAGTIKGYPACEAGGAG